MLPLSLLSYLIKHLVETLGYQRIIASEEMVDFGANKPLDEEEHLHVHTKKQM